MHKYRRRHGHSTFNSTFGFLTGKTAERFYWWELVIFARKLLLVLITELFGVCEDGRMTQVRNKDASTMYHKYSLVSTGGLDRFFYWCSFYTRRSVRIICLVTMDPLRKYIV